MIDEALAPATEVSAELGTDMNFAGMTRREAGCASPEKRVSGLDKAMGNMGDHGAQRESGRWLQCNLRPKIATAKVRGSY